MRHDNRYVWFDLARGLSALLVCAGHLRGAIFIDYSQVQSPTVVDKIFYFLTGLGHQAVMVFFVLSGFFVGGSVLARGDAFRFRDYLAARLARLWVVLLPALIFTAIVDHAIYLISPDILSGAFYPVLNSGPSGDRPYSASIETFFGNVFFLQTIYFPVFGTNGPLWSLANEFWYYIMFPLILIAFYKGMLVNPLIRAGSIVVVVAIMVYVSGNMMGGFLIWLFGVYVYLIYAKSSIKVNKWLTLLSVFLFVGSLIDSKIQFIRNAIGIPNDILLGACFSFMLISIKGKSIGFGRVHIARISRYMSEISYTLYLVHFPLVLLVFCSFYERERLELNVGSFVQYIFWIFSVLLASIVMWWFFERNTPTVRRFVKRYLLNP